MDEKTVLGHVREFFDANPLLDIDVFKEQVDDVYHQSVADQIPAYVPTAVDSALTLSDSYDDGVRGVKYVKARDKSTTDDAPDFDDEGLV